MSSRKRIVAAAGCSRGFLPKKVLSANFFPVAHSSLLGLARRLSLGAQLHARDERSIVVQSSRSALNERLSMARVASMNSVRTRERIAAGCAPHRLDSHVLRECQQSIAARGGVPRGIAISRCGPQKRQTRRPATSVLNTLSVNMLRLPIAACQSSAIGFNSHHRRQRNAAVADCVVDRCELHEDGHRYSRVCALRDARAVEAEVQQRSLSGASAVTSGARGDCVSRSLRD